MPKLPALPGASFLLPLLVCASVVCAQEPLRPGRLSPEELAALTPGLAVEFREENDPRHVGDVRVQRLAALHVPHGVSPTPFLPPVKFTARFSGYLKAPLRGTRMFSVEGNGDVELWVNDKRELNAESGRRVGPELPTELVKGYNRIVISYVAPLGDATFRLNWSGDDFAAEPVPPDVFFNSRNAPGTSVGQQMRRGRELYLARNCGACHAGPETSHELTRVGEAKPLAMGGPSLASAGTRFNTNWMAKWILDPVALRPKANMPHVLSSKSDTAQQQAVDLAAYLAGLGQPSPEAVEPTSDKLVSAGEILFENLGCVACHRFSEPAAADEHGRLSLQRAAAKFRRAALVAFLLKPQAHAPSIRMPDFQLTREEAEPLAAYIRSRGEGHSIEAIAALLPASAARGQSLFGELNCRQCHDTEPANASQSTPRKPLRSFPRVVPNPAGCLARDPPAASPRYALLDDEREALTAFCTTGGFSLLRETPAEYSLRQMQALNCAACHPRDGATNRLGSILDQESVQGLPPELLPPLTWTGEKLLPEFTAQLLQGKLERRTRPWLRGRMPVFSLEAELLAAGLSHEHGFAVDENPQPPPHAELAGVGEALLEKEGGFNCVMCHGVGERAPTAPFEAPGINLADAAARLRYTYVPRWLLDPLRVDPATKMPRFSTDGKTTGLTETLNGDARAQFDAIWRHLRTLPEKPAEK